MAPEYEMILMTGAGTYLFSTLMTLAVSLFVSLMIARKNRKIRAKRKRKRKRRVL